MPILGLTPRDPIGAAVSIGRKGPRGFPVEKDRFFVVAPRDVDGVRPLLPQFAFFNGADPEHRRIIRGNLVHRSKDDCFEQHLGMQTFPKGYQGPRAHPHMRPVCTGDGELAERWKQDPEGKQFARIKCPHRHCEFRTMDSPACKPFSQLIFRLRWQKDGLPTPLVKFTSGSWETGQNILGLFEYLETAAEELGLASPTLFGFPFTLQLIERTKAARRARYPVVVVSPDEDPITFFLRQSERLKTLGALPPPIQSLQDPETVYEDIKQISVPSR